MCPRPLEAELSPHYRQGLGSSVCPVADKLSAGPRAQGGPKSDSSSTVIVTWVCSPWLPDPPSASLWEEAATLLILSWA